MRKIYRLVSRLSVGLTLIGFFYLSKEIYNVNDSSSIDWDSDVIAKKIAQDSSKKDYIQVNQNEDVFNEPERNEHLSDSHRLKHDVVINMNLENISEKKLKIDVNDFHDDPVVKADVILPSFVNEILDEGPGEYGRGFSPAVTGKDKKEAERLFALNDFNQYASDRISIHRHLLDERMPGCKDTVYPSNLPTASVIICFHNEAWSVLLRSVHSIIDRSPEHLLREIILVDDYSTMDHLKEPLALYMGTLPKVKIIRVSSRQGLIRARLLGYEKAEAPVLVFLDSHIECFPGWLEPLVARIAENPKAVPYPVIPVIKRNDFATKMETGLGSVGGFKWDGLFFTWVSVTERDKKIRKRDTDPINSPTMPGGLFAIDKKWFTTLGSYDDGLDFWGGENIELSFKSWMCNGTVEKIPCSQVAHVYRERNPIKWSTGGVVQRNSERVAEVWMDEYKDVFYAFSYPKDEFGDVSERKKLRRSLNCHSFQWYLDEVLQERPPVVLRAGEIRNIARPICLDSMGDKRTPEGYSCHGQGQNQRWVVTADKHLMQGTTNKLCYADRLAFNCKAELNTWDINYENQTIKHIHSGLCLELRIPMSITIANCTGAPNQRWSLPRSIS